MTAGNYSYRARSSWGEGYMMVGDAFAFIDPVFSSGVMLAMTAGELGAECRRRWLDDPASAGAAWRGVRAAAVACASIELGWLIYRINIRSCATCSWQPCNQFRMRDGLVSLLAGNTLGGWKRRLPVLAFKLIYHGLSLAHRLGYRLQGRPAGLAPQPQRDLAGERLARPATQPCRPSPAHRGPLRPCGRFARGYVHWKLRLDPILPTLLRLVERERFGQLVDLGCWPRPVRAGAAGGRRSPTRSRASTGTSGCWPRPGRLRARRPSSCRRTCGRRRCPQATR